MCHTLVHVMQSSSYQIVVHFLIYGGCLPYVGQASQTGKAMHAYWPYTCRAAHATLHYIKPTHRIFWITCWDH